MDNEIWKIVPFATNYEASNKGNVRIIDPSLIRYHTGGGFKVFLSDYGYYATSFKTNDKKWLQWGIHRLVAHAWIENPLNKPQVNHIDGNRINNKPDNLEWVTVKEHKIHGATVMNHYTSDPEIKQIAEFLHQQAKHHNKSIVDVYKLYRSKGLI